VIRVLIVDDHPFVRLGVATLLAQADGIAVVGECSDGSEVLDVAITVEPDVVLMDIHMPGTSGLDATRALLKTRPTVRVLMFTASMVAGHIEEAASAGLKGEVASVALTGGEGSNRWLQVAVVGLRPRDLRTVFEACGLEANRILRTRYGPIAMDRVLARGRSRPLTDGELKALHDTAGARTTGSRSPAR